MSARRHGPPTFFGRKIGAFKFREFSRQYPLFNSSAGNVPINTLAQLRTAWDNGDMIRYGGSARNLPVEQLEMALKAAGGGSRNLFDTALVGNINWSGQLTSPYWSTRDVASVVQSYLNSGAGVDDLGILPDSAFYNSKKVTTTAALSLRESRQKNEREDAVSYRARYGLLVGAGERTMPAKAFEVQGFRCYLPKITGEQSCFAELLAWYCGIWKQGPAERHMASKYVEKQIAGEKVNGLPFKLSNVKRQKILQMVSAVNPGGSFVIVSNNLRYLLGSKLGDIRKGRACLWIFLMDSKGELLRASNLKQNVPVHCVGAVGLESIPHFSRVVFAAELTERVCQLVANLRRISNPLVSREPDRFPSAKDFEQCTLRRFTDNSGTHPSFVHGLIGNQISHSVRFGMGMVGFFDLETFGKAECEGTDPKKLESFCDTCYAACISVFDFDKAVGAVSAGKLERFLDSEMWTYVNDGLGCCGRMLMALFAELIQYCIQHSLNRTELTIYGYNSAKFDLYVLWANICYERGGFSRFFKGECNWFSQQRGIAVMKITPTLEYYNMIPLRNVPAISLVFKDALHNLTICTLSKQMENYEIPEPLRKKDFDHEQITSFEDAVRLKGEWMSYLLSDVCGLAFLYFKCHHLRTSLFGDAFSPFVTCTLASMAERLVYQKAKLVTYCYTSPAVKKFFQDNLYGGKIECYRSRTRFDHQQVSALLGVSKTPQLEKTNPDLGALMLCSFVTPYASLLEMLSYHLNSRYFDECRAYLKGREKFDGVTLFGILKLCWARLESDLPVSSRLSLLKDVMTVKKWYTFYDSVRSSLPVDCHELPPALKECFRVTVDCCSMYPAVMASCPLPGSLDGIWTNKCEVLREWKRITRRPPLFMGNENLDLGVSQFGYVLVDLLPPKGKASLIYSTVPTRMKNGTIQYNFKPKLGHVISTPCLAMALKCGWKVKSWKKMVLFKNMTNLQHVIRELYRLRTDPSLPKCSNLEYKTVMNSFYGKNLIKDIVDQPEVVFTESGIRQFRGTKSVKFTSPKQIGLAVLEWGRTVMDVYKCVLDLHLPKASNTSHPYQLDYQDTDSLTLNILAFERLEDLGLIKPKTLGYLALENRGYFLFGVYPGRKVKLQVEFTPEREFTFLTKSAGLSQKDLYKSGSELGRTFLQWLKLRPKEFKTVQVVRKGGAKFTSRRKTLNPAKLAKNRMCSSSYINFPFC